jgi:hypothetical protein
MNHPMCQMCWKLRNDRYRNCPGYCKALFGFEGETMTEHPCHHCNKDRTCGGTCIKYRGFLAQVAGKAFLDRSAKSAAIIREHRHTEGSEEMG